MYNASTLVWASQALGSGCCNPSLYRTHSSHWQFLSVKTGSVSSHLLQKALSSPQWHLRVLCCSSKRSKITPVHLPGHRSGRLPLSTLLILDCAVAAGCPCLFNFLLFHTPSSGTYHMWLTSTSSLAMQKALVLWLYSVTCERKATKESCLSTILAFQLALPFPQCFSLVILGTYLGCFSWGIYIAFMPLEPTYASTLFYLLLLSNYWLLIHT